MSKAMYIKAASCISPQHSYGEGPMLEPLMSSDTGMLHVVEQDYRKYISPVAIRRMSRLLKMSITAGMQCLADAGVQPDAIITGTGRGSVSDMEHFLSDMITLKEEALNPTYFIQSTYNSVNGWLALQTKCTKYNETFVHRGLSFELALLDAQLTLNEANDTQNILAGGFDEMTDYYHVVKGKIGYWKKEQIDSLELLQHGNTDGTIGGEGASFFVLSNDKGNARAAIAALKVLHKPGVAEMQNAINEMLEQNGLVANDIDVVLSGMNGDAKQKKLFEAGTGMFGDGATVCAYKHLCGDFDTASGFGLWLANKIVSEQNIPTVTIQSGVRSDAIDKLLMVNHTITGDASLILLNSCK
ncbi:MAG: beta-ketoacyl synthase chain length factor [Bacteroidetes bacterium]|nr:beta-ketoacyl synthase chain length factor [Bacteroidota bacterium]